MAFVLNIKMAKTPDIYIQWDKDPKADCLGLIRLWMDSWRKWGWNPRIFKASSNSRIVNLSVMNRGLRPEDRWRKPVIFARPGWQKAKLVDFSKCVDPVTAIHKSGYGIDSR